VNGLLRLSLGVAVFVLLMGVMHFGTAKSAYGVQALHTVEKMKHSADAVHSCPTDTHDSEHTVCHARTHARMAACNLDFLPHGW
jgi:hypothetical protein